LTKPNHYGIKKQKEDYMAREIVGLWHCAKVLGIGVDRIRRLIAIGKIKPKKAGDYPCAPWIFTDRDQKEIRMHTSDGS
jgi:hypothetical protein